MKTVTKILVVALIISVFFNARSQSLEKLKAFTMSIHGTSTLHDWESKVSKAELTTTVSVDDAKVVSISKAELKIQVRDIKSEHGKIMDNKTYEAFNADKNPTISFSLKSFTAAGGQGTMTGNLTMNGTTKPISISISAKSLPNGDVQFIGSYPLKMTDYKMATPTAMMGTIKVADAVTIKFDITVTK